jgi:hypothetical protein
MASPIRQDDASGLTIATEEISSEHFQKVVVCKTATGAAISPLTDTELRATAVPVSGPLTDAELRDSAVPVSLATAPALVTGTATIGAVKDAGPNTRGASAYTTSSDMSTAAAIGPAPTAGQYSVLKEIDISAAVALEFSIQEETSATVFRSFFLPANGTLHIVFRDELKLAVADKRWFGKASIAGNVRIGTVTKSEA